MKVKRMFSSLLLVVCLALAPAALAVNTWYVNGTNGSDSNDCKSSSTACLTIGHAIGLASSGDSVTIAASTYSENLTINKNLRLTGASATSTIIDGGGAARVLSILNTKAVVVISKLTLQDGSASGGGGILNWGMLVVSSSVISGNMLTSESSSIGAGIYNSGTLTVSNSSITGNSGYGNFVYGGGIYNAGRATLTASTISGNVSHGFLGGGGGGVYNASGTLTITNSTLSGNTANAPGGGGIYVSSGTVAINNSTLGGNTAPGYQGGGVYAVKGSKVTIQNSIVANSSTAGNCYGTLTSSGYNMSTDSSCTFAGAGDRNSVNPNLGALLNNGGLTKTMALPSGSPAIDAGNPSGCADNLGHLLKTDQRGKPRPDKEDTGGCDMGAYESQTD